MPELTVEANLAVDLASKDDLEKHHEWLRKRLAVRRANYRVLGGNVPAAQLSNTAVVLMGSLGAPPAGHIYAPQWLAIFGDTPFGAAIANVTAALCVGSPAGPANNTSFSLGDVVLPSLSVPSFVNIPDAVIATAGQRIYVIIQGSGMTGGVTNGYNVNCGVLVGEDSSETRAWI